MDMGRGRIKISTSILTTEANLSYYLNSFSANNRVGQVNLIHKL